jgi:thiosulfate reductase cytochrome b subunit
VPKHHALVRLTHWANVPLLFGLVASGLAIDWAAPVFFKSRPQWFYDAVSLGTGQLAGALRIHWALAYFFMLNGVLYVVGLVVGGGWRALVPRPSDVGEAIAMLRYYAGVVPMAILRRPWPHPAIRSKYNALQRSAYFAMPIFGALLVLSGWAMHKPSQLGWLERAFVSYDGARVVHWLSMAVIASFVVPHVVLVIADGWDTFRSMIVGWSARVRAEHGARSSAGPGSARGTHDRAP